MIAIVSLLLAASTPKLAAMDITARDGVSAGLAQIVTDAVVANVRKRATGTTVIASEDLRNLIGFQAQKAKMGCQEMACLAEIGGALGVDQLIVGSLAKLGKSYILDVRLIDARRAKVLMQAHERLKDKSEEDLLDASERAVATLLPYIVKAEPPPAPSPEAQRPAPVAVAPVAEPTPALTIDAPSTVSHPRPLALVLGGVGVGAAAFAVVGVVEMLSFKGWQSQPAGTTIPLATAQGNVNSANLWATIALASGIAALGLGTGAVITW